MKPATFWSTAFLTAQLRGTIAQRPKETCCLTDEDAAYYIAGFTEIISRSPINETFAAQYLSYNFLSISDSVNFVDQIPLNTTMTHSLAELIQQEAKLPSVVQVRDLFVSHSCDTITWYFEFATSPLPTRGIAILFVDLEKRKIWKSYREVNSAAILSIFGDPQCNKSNFAISVGDDGPEFTSTSCNQRSL